MHRKDTLVGAIEGGGTKWVCAVGTGPGQRLLARVEFPTGDNPRRLLATVVDWLKAQSMKHGKLKAIGIATFGPIDLELDPRRSPTYGYITSTPKLPWQHTEVVGMFERAFPGLPIGFDTDVNGAALGERFWGAAEGLDDFVYITIGTGIGAGGMARGQLLHGLVHPEMGHLRLPRVAGDTFAGVCPYHGDCWEGLCSGVAMQARAGKSAELLPPDHPAWRYETHYIGLAIANIVCTLSPRRVILGGSVRKGGQLGQDAFFRAVRHGTQEALNGYVVSPALLGDGIDTYIVPPALGDDAGVCGAIALGQCQVV
ncbi:MAG TPA: ROK family protein [Pirellulales bacterium]|nr:ROK family protein [Pirellulales bacterium]